MSGHVFVVQGSLAHLDYDAVIVPTDLDFSVLGHWSEVLGVEVDPNGECVVDALRPVRWDKTRLGRSGDTEDGSVPPRPTWFIDAAWYFGQTPAEALDGVKTRLAETLREIAAAGLPRRNGRTHLLVALPTLGTGAGGFGAIRGEVIDALLSTCQAAVGEVGFDVVIVASNPSSYTAFQSRRRELPHHLGHVGAERYAEAKQLAALAADGKLALFLGAGVGIPAGLPSWATLLEQLGAEVEGDISELDSDLDKAEFLREELGDRFGLEVSRLVGGTERYAITHAMLASLGCEEVVTTNYDQLYERAARDIVAAREITTLPFDQTRAHTPWILKMHGDVRQPGSIVLARSDYVSFDAKSRPLGSVVQSLMVTKHLLVVGTSMTDDNFLRLAHEVFAFRDAGAKTAAAGDEPHPPIGTVVSLAHQPAKARLWEKRFNYVFVSEEQDVAYQARDLAIFLDLVALLTAGNAHLIDLRFTGMLGSKSERDAARSARALAAEIDTLPAVVAGPWLALRAKLRELGSGEEPVQVDGYDDDSFSGDEVRVPTAGSIPATTASPSGS